MGKLGHVNRYRFQGYVTVAMKPQPKTHESMDRYCICIYIHIPL